jgi:hypothetical protein
MFTVAPFRAAAEEAIDVIRDHLTGAHSGAPSACALLLGAAGVTEFSDATVVRPDIVSSRQKVRASLDASLPGWCRARQYSADVW